MMTAGLAQWAASILDRALSRAPVALQDFLVGTMIALILPSLSIKRGATTNDNDH